MSNMAHLLETAALLLAAYLAGCVLGYGLRRVLHAARGTRQVAAIPPLAAAMPNAEPRRSPSPAARLAARVDEPLARPPVPRPQAAGTAPTEKIAPDAASAKRPMNAKSAGPKPPTLPGARDGKPDDLKQIKGIGPKIEASLYALGIFHIDQIAAWSKANADWVDAQLAFKGRIRRERWVEQAADLARSKTAA